MSGRLPDAHRLTQRRHEILPINDLRFIFLCPLFKPSQTRGADNAIAETITQ